MFEKTHTLPPIPPMEDSLASIKKAVGVGIIALIVLVLLLIAAIVTNLRLASQIASVANEHPIFVIPGAAEGVYAPGLTKYNVENAARYVVSLGATLTSANAKDRLAELEKYCSPEFQPKFRLEKARLLKEIQDQNQSRSVQPDPETGDALTVDKKKVYTYSMRGAWEIRSGSILMSNIRHEFTIRFTVGNVSKGNPYGIQLQAFDFVPVATTASRRGEVTDATSL